MTVQDDLSAAQRRLDDLMRSLAAVERRVGQGLDMRRAHTDADHLRESLELLREAAGCPADADTDAARRAAAAQPDREIVRIPDTPYDPALWQDAEDEGLGYHARHAP